MAVNFTGQVNKQMAIARLSLNAVSNTLPESSLGTQAALQAACQALALARTGYLNELAEATQLASGGFVADLSELLEKAQALGKGSVAELVELNELDQTSNSWWQLLSQLSEPARLLQKEAGASVSARGSVRGATEGVNIIASSGQPKAELDLNLTVLKDIQGHLNVLIERQRDLLVEC